MKDPRAVALGLLSAGKSKHFTKAELARRRKRMIAMNGERAAKKKLQSR